MDDINVLVTGSGAPGIKGTLYSLINNFDNRHIKTIGTDIKSNVVGKFLCDKFYQISKPSSSEYLEQLFSICKNENVDVLLPQNTSELLILSQNKREFESIGTNIAVSDENSINVANDKRRLMDLAKNIGVPTADFYLVNTFDELIKQATKLGWPGKSVVIKPPLSNGMRGVRIIDESVDLKTILYSEKPSSLYINMSLLGQILGPSFPHLLVMEYLPNDEYTVDILKADTLTVVPRRRNVIHSGISFESTVETNELISEYSIMLANKLKLEYAFGFQFKLDENNVPKLLESNPRVQGTMVLSTFAGANIIYGAVKYALKEDVPQFDIQPGTKILRYWGGIGAKGDKNLGSL